MRRVTRLFAAGVLAVLLLLLALGAVPSYLGSGDPYYLTATPADGDGPAVNVTDYSERRYPYLFGALGSDDGRSEPYQRGRFGVKEAFANSPFDEYRSVRQFAPANATTDDAVVVSYNGTRYRVSVVQP
ncbi:hypothetical protein [Candidatus Halobonum tyrrellensis]|uniref:Uncharacterized protein n=1 Tax=Candidatus Halobonum tyrrellensis G22 TaxID=1324957 RepID=V4GPL4_9EURY|nr:hypothetical protein [Candidatus Halobonum tyrrellensis]ESP87291.1 hypothetical protein K933_14433 [Candidatus Halobonum tyrrellensis G22]